MKAGAVSSAGEERKRLQLLWRASDGSRVSAKFKLEERWCQEAAKACWTDGYHPRENNYRCKY